MAALAASPRLATRTPARLPRVRSSTEVATEPSYKRRKYVAGGSGGGGRWVKGESVNDVEADVTQTVPRARPSRVRGESSTNAHDDEAETSMVSKSPVQSRPRRERTGRRLPSQATPRPRYTNAAAAAAASQASDGYKPREERSWEDFHPDLDIEAGLLIFTADEVDGRTNKSDPKAPPARTASSLSGEVKHVIDGDVEMHDAPANTVLEVPHEPIVVTPLKRKPGRPPRRPESMLSGLGSPPAPRIMPLPTHNPKERLNLPKPSFRHFNHFLQYEENQRENKVNYVDRTMSHIGYQESDRFVLPPKVLIRLTESQQAEDEAEVSLRLESDGPVEASQAAPVVGKVEYDMDEQDEMWLDELNDHRKAEGVDAIKPAIFEITMTQIEKEYHALEKRIPKPQPRHAQTHRPRSSSQAAVNGDPNPPGDEPDSKCSICDDGDCENANAIIFCDGCDLAVHQECYGVPFIPEGQWFCRKCKEIGRGTPTCIFCPNVDGAFKQTNTLRWSHLLCAIWIPEVTVANMTFMEPITDVDKVPKSRWKLNCYICNQKMGACIQCGNKNCYLAFHVTCARRAKLFLKMKSQHQAGIDTTALKAFCDKHVPPDWRRTHETDTAIVEAKRWYRHTMKDRKWADSHSVALELGAPPPPDGGPGGDGVAEDTIAVTKRRRNQPQKLSWRLPSGAPVVPSVVFNTVDASLVRFTIRKRKEFVEKSCKYWTLKREARRGAALLKRLQLQLESFSSMEITRRNFAGMGSAGRPRLHRRIDFAEMLQKDMGHLTELCRQVQEREEIRLKEVELLRELVDTVYFPISPLLLPILQRAQKLDEKTQMFKTGFETLAHRLRERFYTSVQHFSRDLSLEISKVVAATGQSDDLEDADITVIHNQLNEVKPGTAEHLALTHEQKEMKKLAKRIVKAVKEPLEEALKKESELKGREQEEALRKLDSMGIFASSRTIDADDPDVGEVTVKRRSDSDATAAAGAPLIGDVQMHDADERTDEAVIHLKFAGRDDTVAIPPKKQTPESKAASYASPTHKHSSKKTIEKPTEPLSPPNSTDSLATAAAHAHAPDPTDAAEDANDVLAQGGVPWYLAPFDPVGTTVHEERYTGRAVLREMSEELSDMDEDTLTELAPVVHAETTVPADVKGGGDDVTGGAVREEQEAAQEKEKEKKRKAAARKRKSGRRRW